MYTLKKENDEKIEAQRFLKYQEKLRENRCQFKAYSHNKQSKSVCILPLYKRSYELNVQKDNTLRGKQRDKKLQQELDYNKEMEIHHGLSIHNKNKRKYFSQRGNFRSIINRME